MGGHQMAVRGVEDLVVDGWSILGRPQRGEDPPADVCRRNHLLVPSRIRSGVSLRFTALTPKPGSQPAAKSATATKARIAAAGLVRTQDIPLILRLPHSDRARVSTAAISTSRATTPADHRAVLKDGGPPSKGRLLATILAPGQDVLGY